MAVVRRVSVRDLLLFALVAGFLLQHALPRISALAQDAGPVTRAPLGSAFTYQGRLEVDGVPASGEYEFVFELWTAVSGGVLVDALPPLPVVIENGIFAARLAFDASAFDGEAVFLEIAARPSDEGDPHTSLGDRVELTATPYALYAKSADWNGLANVPAEIEDLADGHDHIGESWSGNFAYGLTVDAINGTGLRATGNLGGVLGFTSAEGVAAVTGTNSHACSLLGEECWGVRGDSNDVGVIGDGDSTGVVGRSESGVGVSASGITGINAVGDSYGIQVSANLAAISAFVNDTSGNGITATGSGRNTSGAGVLGLNSTAANSPHTCTGLGASQPDTYCFAVVGNGTFAPNTAGVGVYGLGNNTGVWAAGGALGIYADGTSYAGYFDGLVRVESLENPSDLRLKRDIASLGYGLDAVLELEPRRYSYTEGDGSTHFGLITQDVEKVLPELVGTDPTTGMLSLNYVELIPVLVQAIQDQQALIGGDHAPSAVVDSADGARDQWVLLAVALGVVSLAANGVLMMRTRLTAAA